MSRILTIPAGTLLATGGADWSPADLDALAWYDAADDSSITHFAGAVSQLNDKSGNGYHLTQGVGSKQPITGTRTLNGINVLDFTPIQLLTSIALGTALTGLNKEFSVFAVLQTDDYTIPNQYPISLSNQAVTFAQIVTFGIFNPSFEWRAFFRNNAGDDNANFVGTVADNNVKLLSMICGSPNLDMDLDGSDVYDGDRTVTGAQDMDIFSIGAISRLNDDGGWDGIIAEVIVLDYAPDQATKEIIEGYLAHKWGTEANLPLAHPYSSENPLVGTANVVEIAEIPWTPAQTTTAAWFDGADDGTITHSLGNVSQWDDKSGENNHILQGNGALQPQRVGQGIDFVNGQLLERFGASNVHNANGKCSLFAVHKIFDPSTSTVNFIRAFSATTTGANPGANRRPRIYYARDLGEFILANAKTGGMKIDATVVNGTKVISYVTSDLTESIYLNGILAVNEPSVLESDVVNLSLEVGDRNNQNLVITFNEIILIADEVSQSLREIIEGYLAWKWALSDDLPASHPYKYQPPLV